MWFTNLFKIPDINAGVAEYNATPDAVLLDVRTPQEYQDGHIPGSKNIPLQCLTEIKGDVREKNTPIFVYCYSGSRSGQAVAYLKQMGYINAKNIGGISSYRGKVIR